METLKINCQQNLFAIVYCNKIFCVYTDLVKLSC